MHRTPAGSFDDDLDPDACGIPTPWGDDEPALLDGVWDGELIEPDVLLFDSHLRTTIVGQGAHGAEVGIVMHRGNPKLLRRDHRLGATATTSPLDITRTWDA